MSTARFPAFVVRRQDDGVTSGVEELGLDDLPPGEVLIEVSWSSVNYKDGMVTVPGNRVARISPLVPGVDLAGTVIESDDPFNVREPPMYPRVIPCAFVLHWNSEGSVAIEPLMVAVKSQPSPDTVTLDPL